jgi:PAS domain S-box-containing protein
VKLFGYKDTHELIGKPVVDTIAPEERNRIVKYIAERANDKEAHNHYEIKGLRRNGTTFDMEVMISTYIFNNEIYTVGFQNDITERTQAEKALAQSRDQLRALAAYYQTAVEDERTAIAREIHDEFGQSMTALKMDLSWLARRLPEKDERAERIKGMDSLVDDSITLMRRIATELRPNLLDDLGLSAALEWQAHEFSRRTNIECSLDLAGYIPDLDQFLRTSLFRIFQESLTNVSRHAQATLVSVSLEQQGQALILTIRDNGRGITDEEKNDPRALGLLGLRERAARWNGTLVIHGEPGQGTTVTVCIPLPAQAERGGQS